MFSVSDHASNVKRPSCERAPLVLRELGGRVVSSATELGDAHDLSFAALDRLAQHDALDSRPAVGSADLHSEGEQLVALGD